MPGDTATAAVGRRLRVSYSFWGAHRQMEQSFVLAPDEQRIKTGLIGVGGLGVLDVRHMGLPTLRFARLSYRTSHGLAHLDLTAATNRALRPFG